ncbi:MAG: class II aldolase/adducin family protein [Pseudomonadota bacterium]
MVKKKNIGHYVAPSKEEFCRFCHLLYERHLVTGVGGNVSARSGENVFLTPSGLSLRDVDKHTVVTVSGKGQILEGGRPTKDASMHLALLGQRPEINVVCHVHGAHIIAASAMLTPGPDTLPPLTPGFVYYAYPLPMAPFIAPGTKALTETVLKVLSHKKHRAILLRNHGLVTLGKDFSEAVNIAEEIDEVARIFVLTGGKAKTIPLDEIKKIAG